MTAGARPPTALVLRHHFASHASPWAALRIALENRGPAFLVVIDDVSPGGSTAAHDPAESESMARAVTELSSAGLLSVVVLGDDAGASVDAVPLALASDLRWATPSATLLGGPPSADHLPYEWVADSAVRRLGRSRALALALAAAPIDAATAQVWGLIDEIVPNDTISDRIAGLASRVASTSQGWLAETKALLTAADARTMDRRFSEAVQRLRAEAVGDG